MNNQPDHQPSTSSQSKAGLSEAAKYWDKVLDPQNLERESQPDAPGMPLEDEIDFAHAPDLLAARDWLVGGTSPAWIMDLGAGLGANSFALIRLGHRVIAVDTSLDRLRSLRERAHLAGCEQDLVCLVAQAESLPFANGSVPAVYTKSVLIHTDLAKAAKELHRVLMNGGRGALVEPQPGNPFVRLYRATLAPQVWRSITRYFDSEAQAIFLRPFGFHRRSNQVIPLYFLSFFAFVFQFALPNLLAFKVSLKVLHGLDRLLFRLLPPLRRWAWFGLIRIEKKP